MTIKLEKMKVDLKHVVSIIQTLEDREGKEKALLTSLENDKQVGGSINNYITHAYCHYYHS